MRAALGAYLFALLQFMGIQFQGFWSSVPAQVFQVAPFPLMIFTLLLVNLAQKGTPYGTGASASLLRRIAVLLSGSPPEGLGRSSRRE